LAAGGGEGGAHLVQVQVVMEGVIDLSQEVVSPA